MTRFSRHSRRRLAAILSVVGVIAIGAGIAGAALGASDSTDKPPKRPLAQAVLASLTGPPVEGVTARVHLTNHLLPPGSLPKGSTLPFGASADGRIWLARDGRLRLDVHSDAGDAEITYDGSRVSIYEAGSKTVFRAPLRLPAVAGGGSQAALGTLATKLAPLMSVLDVSDAVPSSTAGRPTYTVRITPKDDGGLLGGAELAFDADHGIPLRAAVYQHGDDAPVLELAATEVDYGPVADADLAARPHPDAKVVDVAAGRSAAPAAAPSTVSGVDAVRRRLTSRWPRPRRSPACRAAASTCCAPGATPAPSPPTAAAWAPILVFETKADARSAPMQGMKLPEVNIDGRTGTELATALGTVLTVERDGVQYRSPASSRRSRSRTPPARCAEPPCPRVCRPAGRPGGPLPGVAPGRARRWVAAHATHRSGGRAPANCRVRPGIVGRSASVAPRILGATPEEPRGRHDEMRMHEGEVDVDAELVARLSRRSSPTSPACRSARSARPGR